MNAEIEKLYQELERPQNENKELQLKVENRERKSARLENLDVSGPIELVVLSVKEHAIRCRLLTQLPQLPPSEK